MVANNSHIGEQALAHVSILRKIVHDLEAAPGHVLPEEHVMSILEEHFGTEEAQAQLETAINWAATRNSSPSRTTVAFSGWKKQSPLKVLDRYAHSRTNPLL